MPNLQHKNGCKGHQRSNLHWHYIKKNYVTRNTSYFGGIFILVSKTTRAGLVLFCCTTRFFFFVWIFTLNSLVREGVYGPQSCHPGEPNHQDSHHQLVHDHPYYTYRLAYNKLSMCNCHCCLTYNSSSLHDFFTVTAI